ncbi:hypothetical protein AMTR_s00055p00211270 [Amborella trichopoda]|uniref:Glycoside hydrolase family 38 N-terminal domain-containing protein n=1 Tax=Amborella trichopoda TaxID=13333 RepID=U5DD74_AMBTC|nr:hypothetical protein AMTR_s00055p00211270 [Amborella trichopoda]
MAFSPSGSRRGTIVRPSRLKGKPLKRRRCFRLRNLLSTNLCILAFFFCALLFLFVILTQNIPKPQNLHRPHHHPFSRSRNPNSSLLEARVDITTKDLYDRIEFLDVDGGPWKQGWEVSFKGDEWDGEKLKVFVVPHSHNDPGWKLTVEEYYLQKSRHILDAIVQTLSKDSRRKFIWEEMSYLERWWRDASASKRDDFIKIVKNGQLEIVGGGWVMNDEAFLCLSSIGRSDLLISPFAALMFTCPGRCFDTRDGL